VPSWIALLANVGGSVFLNHTASGRHVLAVGSTLLTGGVRSVSVIPAGVLVLGLIFNMLDFESGMGWTASPPAGSRSSAAGSCC
jgi:ribose/xylose/arabinose/galactoside ABC-type transport system permease subunit